MTARTGWLLSEDELRAWLGGLIGDDRSIVAPVEKEQPRTFRTVTDAADVCLAPGKTRWSPKEYLFPRTEVLFNYSMIGDEVVVEDPVTADCRLILFGLRPCDAAAVARLDAVFLGGEIDPFYARRRAATTIVALACPESEAGCFCAAVGGSPAGETGCDVMVIALAGGFLVHVITHAGGALIEAADHDWTPAAKSDWKKASHLTKAVETSMNAPPFDPSLSTALEQRFDDDVWLQYGAVCLSCSVCSSVCPTCSCFDMAHDGTAWGGSQFRTWDACTFSRFTTHASGHDPRSSQAARYRQRILHKFAYARDHEHYPFRCVGCGRCTALCPVGLDIQQAIREIAKDKSTGTTHVNG